MIEKEYPKKRFLLFKVFLVHFFIPEGYIKPTRQLKWIVGLKAAFNCIGAYQRGPYSWIGKTVDLFVFTAEIDHIDKQSNIYDHNAGTFEKWVPPLSVTAGDAALSVSHSKELFDAVSETQISNQKCKLLLVRGTKFGETRGSIKAAVDGNNWVVTLLEGSADKGYNFKLERAE